METAKHMRQLATLKLPVTLKDVLAYLEASAMNGKMWTNVRCNDAQAAALAGHGFKCSVFIKGVYRVEW